MVVEFYVDDKCFLIKGIYTNKICINYKLDGDRFQCDTMY